MKTLSITWVFCKNLIALSVYAGMLSVANSDFENVVVAGLCLIYIAVTSNSTVIIRAQFGAVFKATEQFHRLIRIIDNKADLGYDDEALKAAIDEVKSLNPEYYINLGFNFIFWVVSIGVILQAVLT